MEEWNMRIQVLGLISSVALLACAACGGDSKKETCPAGAENCACGAEDSCNEGLECKDGFCVKAAEECPAGTNGCPCNEDGTCQPGGAETLECKEGLCVPEGTEVGGLGDPCGEDKPCGVHEGTQLECKEGTCRLPEEECPAGTLDCPCNEGACAGGLECADGKCKAPAGSGVVVGNGAVRACDVVLEAAGVDVSFSGDVIGVTKREGDRLAFSFTAKADVAVGSVAALVAGDGSPYDASGITADKVECYDRLGKAVAAPELSFK